MSVEGTSVWPSIVTLCRHSVQIFILIYLLSYQIMFCTPAKNRATLPSYTQTHLELVALSVLEKMGNWPTVHRCCWLYHMQAAQRCPLQVFEDLYDAWRTAFSASINNTTMMLNRLHTVQQRKMPRHYFFYCHCLLLCFLYEQDGRSC